MGAAVSALLAVASGSALTAWVLDRPAATSGDATAALGAPSPQTSTPGAPSIVPSERASLTASPRPSGPATAAPEPTMVRIRALGIDASVRPVGVQPDGAMAIPAAPTSVGWYRFGPAPGASTGHAVIAGHVATREDGPGALAALGGAEEGMEVEVVDSVGTVHRYRVTGRESVRKRALPVDRIFARDGEPLLVLITCGGEYLPELRSHRDNVLVTAVPVRG